MIRMKDLPPESRRRLRELRREAKRAERAQFVAYCLAAGLTAPEAEHHFKAGRRWRFDWAWPERRVALEVEGGVWTEGRHTRGAGFLGDMAKYNEAALLGWRILRCTPSEMYEPATLFLLLRALNE